MVEPAALLRASRHGRRPAATAAALLALALASSACNTRALLNCVDEPAPALNVTVLDGATGAYLAADATVVARDGSFRDTLGPGDYAPGGELASRAGAMGRIGTYEITVTHAGYLAWTTRVRVRSDRCGVVTVPVRAELTRG